MKESILKYFRHDRSYEGGVTLYMKYGNRIGFKRQLNVQEKTDHLLNTLHEELRVLAGIDSHAFRALMSVKVTQEKPKDPQVAPVKAPAKKKVNQPKKKNPPSPPPSNKTKANVQGKK